MIIKHITKFVLFDGQTNKMDPQLHADFIIESLDGPLDIENAIIDKLGQNDIKWEHLGEMNDPRVNRITYEEVIDDTRPIQTKKVLGVEVGTGASV